MSVLTVYADPEDAAICLAGGGVLLFPTETFYALGCLATQGRAVGRVYQLKGRSVQQPLPLLAADMDQAASLACLDGDALTLATLFWPGPLSLLLPVRPGALQALPSPLVNSAGKIALRVTPHPLAALLARLAGGPLTASSANLSGKAPARYYQEVSPELTARLAAAQPAGQGGLILPRHPDEDPAGGAPSTLVEPLGGGRVRILRSGALGTAMLAEAGFCGI
ncbi:MAG: L-threonylcarbamoyladenylate synthase [Desulfovibrio sp.]|nr:L-threonylcarbamoyladenylate synthase [Desulfovibrio sp.]